MNSQYRLGAGCFDTEVFDLLIRKFENADAAVVAALIRKTLIISNGKDYPQAYIEHHVQNFIPDYVIQRASWTHFYVVCEDEKIIGCGAIGPYWDSEVESSLFCIYILPEHQGRGIGRAIIETLEQDEYFLRAKRIEIPSSITACAFYRKMGYDYKNGVDHADEEQLYRLEKFR